MARFVNRSRNEWWGTTWKLVLFVGSLLLGMFVVYQWRGPLPALLLMLASLWMYFGILTRDTGYRCAACGKAFQVPKMVNFLTMSGMAKEADGTYYPYKALTCPHCGKRSKARLVKQVDATGQGKGTFLRDGKRRK